MDQLARFEKILKDYNSDPILVITGSKFLSSSRIGKEYLSIINRQENVVVCNKAEPNPFWEQIIHSYMSVPKKQYRLVVSIGGGSVIDLAKILRVMLSAYESIDLSQFSSEQLLSLEFDSTRMKHMAIPTTFGTGAESTQFATFYVNNKKFSLDQKGLNPEIILLDSRFLEETPLHLSASAAMDAFSHAIESIWSIHASEDSLAISKEALELIWANIEGALLRKDGNSCAKLALGSSVAGRAIQITRTTACHSISYPLTSYFNVSHGQAVVISIPLILPFNSMIGEKDCNDPKGVIAVRERINVILNILGVKSPEGAAQKIRDLIIGLGLKTRLSELGVKNTDLNHILKNAFTPSRINNNPRRIRNEDLQKILREML